MSAIARSTPATSGVHLLGKVVDAGASPPTVIVDGSDTATEASTLGTYVPVTGERVVLKKVGRQLIIAGVLPVPGAIAMGPPAWIRVHSAAAIVCTANTWREAGPDTTDAGGASGQITRSGATLIIPADGYYMLLVRVQWPTLAAVTRLMVTPDYAGVGAGGSSADQRTDVTYPVMTNGPLNVSHPIPSLYSAGDIVGAYLYSSQTLTIPANGLTMYGWRV